MSGSGSRVVLIVCTSLALVLSAAPAASAQVARRMLPPSVSLHAGAFFFDLSGTGTAPMIALRGTRSLSQILVLEGGILAAFPEQQFGERTTFLAPEVQLQFHWPSGWIAPYAGFGAGFVADIASEEVGGTDFDVTMSGAVGVRLALGYRVGVQADARVRGIGTGFQGSASELTAGVLWHFR